MKSKLQQLKQEILGQLKKTTDASVLQKIEAEYLGRKGKLALLYKDIKNLPVAERKEAGKLITALKTEIESTLSSALGKTSAGRASDQTFDFTLPGEKVEGGHLHPLTLVQRDLAKIFSSMGFMVLDGPQLESDYYNFEALNIPPSHPARDMQDTFFIDKKNKDGELDLVMRTHTSSVQVRTMQKYGAPLRCVALGKIYRNEEIDASHEHTFYQVEGLMIDEKISLANLISVLQEMLSGLYQQEIKVRIRPGYFPFVEPGLEIDMSCNFCQGKGCPVCKKTGWIEMLGAGLVHPNVLQAGNIDPKKYQGFAFGMGLERMAMLKYGIDDIRLFHSGDLNFLKQF